MAKAMAMAMARLPREMVDEVLCRLTVRDLLRYRSVCKEWRSRIDGLDFMKMHLKRSSQKMGIFINAFLEGLYWVDLETLDSAVQISHLPFSPEEIQRRRPRTTSILSRGGCSGLLLVEGLGKLAIWNPSTRWHMHVLASGNSVYNSSTSVIGFGCGTLNDGDPKLLISTAISLHPRDEIVYGRRFELFSSKTRTWKTLGTGFPDYFGFEYGHALVHNCDDHNHNALHWIVAPRLGGVVARHERFILAFDLVTEEQRKFSMPNFEGERCSHHKVVEFGGYLCVVCCVVSDSRFDIWAMKEYGESSTWAKLFSVVPPPSNGSPTIYFELIPLTYNYKTSDEVLLFVDRKRFILYDLKTKTSKDVSISGLPAGPSRCFSPKLCVSSLVRVDGAMISCECKPSCCRCT